MNDISFETISTALVFLLLAEFSIFFVFLMCRKLLTKTRFFRFLGLFAIGSMCSMIPFGPLGFMMGAPSILLASVLASIFLDREENK